jgi:hypothetical protein
MRALSGEVEMKGQYRKLVSDFNEVSEDQRSKYLIGGIRLNTSSYLWDPDIVQIDLNGAYSPETRDETYLTIPDRSEVRTLKKAEIRTTFCNNRPVTLQGFFNYDQNYHNRELLTNVKTTSRQWGGMVSLNNKIIPASVTYRNTGWDQLETQTGRAFNLEQENLQARTSKSFTAYDRSELIYSRNNYLYRYAELHRTRHLINRLALNNNIHFDPKKRYSLNSRISWYDQEGTTSFRRFEVLEGIQMILPHQLRFSSHFDLYNLEDPVQVWKQKRIRTSLQHRLFQSLSTKVFYEHAWINQTTVNQHKEADIRGGIDLKYSKKIPTGTLNLSYRYYRHHHRAEGVTGILYVINEEHTLTDGELEMLDKPYVDIASVMVKDLTGSIIYQPGMDYILMERASFVEIQRVPGGQIPDQGPVYVDYAFQQPGSYSYGANNNHFRASVLLFKNLIELYYHCSVQDYPKVEYGELLTLNYYTQHLFGARVDVGFARGGIESDMYNSNIVPYKMMRYYLDLNWNYKSRLLLNVNGNIRNYRMIADEVDQIYSNLSGKIAYKIRQGMNISVESGYLNQRGLNIDLDLVTARAEFHSVFQKLHLRIGVEMYKRMYLNSNFAFNGAYVQVTRKF